MKRREFITLIGGAAVSSVSRPYAALAQERVRRIGVVPHTHRGRRARGAKLRRGVPAEPAGGRLDRWTQSSHRSALERRQRGAQAPPRPGAGGAFARCDAGCQQSRRNGHAAGHSHGADRVRAIDRSDWQRSHREPLPARRQRHWLHPVRIRPERQAAGAAQGDRPRNQARGSVARSGQPRRHWSVGHHPGRCRRRGDGSDARSRSPIPARSSQRHGLCARAEWRTGGGSKRRRHSESRSDHRKRGPVPIARGDPIAILSPLAA